MKLPGNMQAMMKQAEQMQKKMQEEIALIRVEVRENQECTRGDGGASATPTPEPRRPARSRRSSTVRTWAARSGARAGTTS